MADTHDGLLQITLDKDGINIRIREPLKKAMGVTQCAEHF